VNEFKSKAKSWISSNPASGEQQLRDYCEELIPFQYFASHGWLVEQTVQWYKHVQSQQDRFLLGVSDEDEVE
jgi:hypothetical protein